MLVTCGYLVEPVTTWNSAFTKLKSSTFYRIVSDLHVVSDARHGIEMLGRIGSLNPPRTLVISKFTGSLTPRILEQLPFIEFTIEKSKIIETADVWKKFLSYKGTQDISRLIVNQRWFDLESSRTVIQKRGMHDRALTVSRLLSDLPRKVPDLVERAFLAEALDCYDSRAYRASIVMTWNLVFDHLLRWIAKDAQRLQNFNTAISKRYPLKSGMKITKLEDFQDLRESESIEICGTANLISRNVVEILRDKLKRRNAAAHPSQVIFTQAQADDTITDLVNNVLLVHAT